MVKESPISGGHKTVLFSKYLDCGGIDGQRAGWLDNLVVRPDAGRPDARLCILTTEVIVIDGGSNWKDSEEIRTRPATIGGGFSPTNGGYCRAMSPTSIDRPEAIGL